MRKTTFLLFLTLLVSLICEAQKSSAHPIQAENVSFAFGARGGLTHSDISKASIPGNSDIESKSGIHFSFLLHKPISKNWAIQPELGYSPQGYIEKNVDTFYGNYYESKHTLSYLNIPVLVKCIANNGLYLQSGPQIGILFGSSYGEASTLDLSWSAGGGFISRIGLGLDVRYNAGLTKIAKSNPMFPTDNIEVRNKVFQLSLVYIFAIAKKRKG